MGMFAGTMLIVACRPSDDGRVNITGTVNLKGKPVPSGTLVLTPQAGEQMPVATGVTDGKFVFDKTIGPRPGPHVARLNPEEATIEEISQASDQNPSEAAKTFNANRSPSLSTAEVIVEINDVQGQAITIELK
jgi:hypothetical protein